MKNRIEYSLAQCENDECRVLYMGAMKNLKHPELLSVLLDNAENGRKSLSVAAMKALKAMPKHYWDKTVIKTCQRIFYQLKKRYDSSSRTLAVDIILDSKPSEKMIEELVMFLTRQEKEYEVKQFLFQRLHMIADKCFKFKNTLTKIIRGDPTLNNWNILGQRGLIIRIFIFLCEEIGVNILSIFLTIYRINHSIYETVHEYKFSQRFFGNNSRNIRWHIEKRSRRYHD